MAPLQVSETQRKPILPVVESRGRELRGPATTGPKHGPRAAQRGRVNLLEGRKTGAMWPPASSAGREPFTAPSHGVGPEGYSGPRDRRDPSDLSTRARQSGGRPDSARKRRATPGRVRCCTALGAAVRAARIEAASAAGPQRDRVARRADQLAGRLARASARSPVRRPRLGEDDAPRSMGLAVAATVRVGIRRREGQRSDRPADLCRRRRSTASRGSIRACSTRWRQPGVSVEGTVVPRLGAALARMGERPRPGPRRPASAR